MQVSTEIRELVLDYIKNTSGKKKEYSINKLKEKLFKDKKVFAAAIKDGNISEFALHLYSENLESSLNKNPVDFQLDTFFRKFFFDLMVDDKGRIIENEDLQNLILNSAIPPDSGNLELTIDNFIRVYQSLIRPLNLSQTYSVVFFLSYLWKIQMIEVYPLFYTISIKALQFLNLLDENFFKSQQLAGKYYKEFILAIKQIEDIFTEINGISPSLIEVEHFLVWVLKRSVAKLHTKEIVIKYNKEEEKTLDLKKEIKSFEQYLKFNNLYYKDNLLLQSIISMQTRPILINIGPSGMGKTKFAQNFALYFTKGKKENITSIFINPSITNENILGKYNEHSQEYELTPFLKIMLKARKDIEEHGKNANLYFVILEDIETKPVENYLYNIIAGIKSRRLDEKGNITQDSISLHNKNYYINATDELDNSYIIPPNITLPVNLFIIANGNVNKDNFHNISKLLEIGNLLEFNKIYINGYKDMVLKSSILNEPEFSDKLIKYLSNNGNFIQILENNIVFDKYYIEELQNLNKILSYYNLHISYRTLNLILQYLWNAKRANIDPQNCFDTQIRYRILTKLHNQYKDESLLYQLYIYTLGIPHINEYNITKDLVHAIELIYDENEILYFKVKNTMLAYTVFKERKIVKRKVKYQKSAEKLKEMINLYKKYKKFIYIE